MTQPLPQTSQGNLARAAAPVVLDMAGSRQALVLGPGLSTEEETVELVRALALNCKIPMVLDADALNALAGDLENQGFGASPQAVLTPHPGEAARLLGVEIKEILEDRPKAARSLAQITGCVTVLKGPRTLIADPAGDLWVNPTGNVLLASGGSGDVLSGVIGGLMAQGLSALDSACAGVYVHGLAADLAMDEYGGRGLAADELVDFLVMAFQALESGEDQGELEEM
jgi:NAD(P)H-hydrate epimerase